VVRVYICGDVLMTYRVPYDVARKVCLEKCHKIREYLTPLFGPDFAGQCVPIEESNEKQLKSRPGRKPRSPSLPVKRPAEAEDEDIDRTIRHPNKRRALKPCASGIVTPPPIPSDLKLDSFGPLSTEDISSMLSAARELMRLQLCPSEGTPYNEWPEPGDSKLGGSVSYGGRRYFWNGAEKLTEKPTTPKTPLPSVKQMVQSVVTTSYPRFPITPSPHHSPLPTPSYDWSSSTPTHALISPPMSIRESFNGFGRERQYSVNNSDECRTPIQESYSDSLFPTPQPEGRYEGKYEDERAMWYRSF
jgi:hypothetical protein